jgi:hypothetical protein
MTRITVLLSMLAMTGYAQVTQYSGTSFRQAQVVDDTLLRAGRVELGVALAGMWNHSSVTPTGMATVSQNTIYAAPGIVGGYMVLDWLEVRGLLEFQYVGTSIDGRATQDTLAGAAAVQGLAQMDFGLGIGGYGGLGLGGYFGHRNDPSPTPGVSYGFTSYGGLGQVLVGLLVQPGAHLMMRGGLRLDLLFGSESPDNGTLGLTGRFAFNANLMAELTIAWRF